MAERSKNNMIRRRSLYCAAASAFVAGAAGAGADSGSGLACVTSSAGTASTFSTSKERTFCGLLSSRIVKFSGFNFCTNFPFLSRTVTFTSTSSDSACKRYSVCCCDGNGALRSTSVSSRAAVLSVICLRVKVMQISLFEKASPKTTATSETKARRHRELTHAPSRRHPPKRRRIDSGIDRRVVHHVENVAALRTELEHARFLHRNDFGERHIEHFAARADNAVTPRVAELPRRRRHKCGRIEPLLNRRIRHTYRLSGNQVRTQRAVGSTVDIGDIAQESRRKRQAGRDRPVSAPLPVAKNGAPRRIAGEPALVVSKGQLPQIIRGELVRLVETGKPALRR